MELILLGIVSIGYLIYDRVSEDEREEKRGRNR